MNKAKQTRLATILVDAANDGKLTGRAYDAIGITLAKVDVDRATVGQVEQVARRFFDLGEFDAATYLKFKFALGDGFTECNTDTIAAMRKALGCD